MAVYFMLCRDGDGSVLDVRDADWTNTAVTEATVLSADLSSQPEVGGTYQDATYTPPPPLAGEYVGTAWSGDGVLAGGTFELTADGVNVATLTLTKRRRSDDSAVGSGSEEYWVAVDGTSVNPDVGKVTLSSGVGSVSFTPTSSQLGRATIVLTAVDSGSPEVGWSYLAAL